MFENIHFMYIPEINTTAMYYGDCSLSVYWPVDFENQATVEGISVLYLHEDNRYCERLEGRMF